MRFDGAAGEAGLLVAVAELDYPMFRARRGQRVDDAELHRGRRGGGHAYDGRAERLQPLAHATRQNLVELGERALTRFRHAGAFAAAGLMKGNGHRQRFVVVEHERWQRGAGAQLVSTRRTARRVDGIAKGAQAVDIAAERSCRHLESVRQVCARPDGPRLEQGEQAEQTRRGAEH